jgi:hypothetical protein
LKRAIVAVREEAAAVYEQRLSELSYLANVLVSGCSIEGRAFRPIEAADAAVAVCNLGLERFLRDEAGEGSTSEATVEEAAQLLTRQELVKLFQIGWSLLHRDVLLFAARALEGAIAHWRALLSEYPLLPKVIEGESKEKDEAQLCERFLSTAEQIDAAHNLVRRLSAEAGGRSDKERGNRP